MQVLSISGLIMELMGWTCNRIEDATVEQLKRWLDRGFGSRSACTTGLDKAGDATQ